MSGPGFTRPDLCSIRAATGQAESAERSPACTAPATPLVRDDLLAALARDVACTPPGRRPARFWVPGTARGIATRAPHSWRGQRTEAGR